MGKVETFTGRLETFLSQCHKFDELPHSFDDTLIDKLIDNIDYQNGELVNFVEGLLKNFDVESRALPIQVKLRLITASIVNKTFGGHCLLKEFVQESEALLRQEPARPPKLIHDLLLFYAVPDVFFTRINEWQGVLDWSLDALLKDSTTIFVSKRIQQFWCSFPVNNSMKANVLRLANVMINRLEEPQLREQVVNAMVTILKHFMVLLTSDVKARIVDEFYKQTARVGTLVFEFFEGVRRLTPKSKIDFSPGAWKNELNRIGLYLHIMKCGLLTSAEENKLDLVIVSPAFKASHFRQVVGKLEQKQVLHFLMRYMNSGAFSSAHEQIELLTAIKGAVDKTCIKDLLLGAKEEVKLSAKVWEMILDAYGKDFLEGPQMTFLKSMTEGIIEANVAHEDWERRDNALEVAAVLSNNNPSKEELTTIARDDPSPYVQVTAFRILKQRYGDVPTELAFHVFSKHDPVARLAAAQLLLDPKHYNRSETADDHFSYDVIDVIRSCLQDDNVEVQVLAVKASSAVLEMAENRHELKELLKQHVSDSNIGPDVCRLLGEDAPGQVDSACDVLGEMLMALRLGRPEEDTMDCY